MGNKLRILRYIGFIPASFVGYALSTLSLMFVCKYIGSWWWIIDLSGGIDSVTTGVMNNNYISVTIIGLVKGVCGVSGGTLLGSLVYGSKKMLGVKIISIFTIFCNVLLLAFWENNYPTTISSIGEIVTAVYFCVYSFQNDQKIKEARS